MLYDVDVTYKLQLALFTLIDNFFQSRNSRITARQSLDFGIERIPESRDTGFRDCNPYIWYIMIQCYGLPW
jgi:hypothetical protein